MKEAARRAGASAAHLIEQPMAAAIGAGLDIHEPVGNMVVDVGGGTTETAVISLGGVVASHAIRCGGFDMDAAIQHYVRQEYGIAIGERTGEELKLAIGSALPYADEVKAEVRGREIATGLPKTVVLSPEEIRFALRDQVELIVATVVDCLGESPPELAQDIIYEGIHLVGGRPAAGPGQSAGRRDRGAGPPGGHPARVRGGRRRACASTRSTACDRSSPPPSPDRAGGSLHGQKVLGHLADLPVAIVEAPPQRRLHRGTVERGQGHRGPPAYGRLVLEGRRGRRAGRPGRRWPPGRPPPPPDRAGRRGPRRPRPARRGRPPPSAPAVRPATTRPSPPPRGRRRPDGRRCPPRAGGGQLDATSADRGERLGQGRPQVLVGQRLRAGPGHPGRWPGPKGTSSDRPARAVGWSPPVAGQRHRRAGGSVTS